MWNLKKYNKPVNITKKKPNHRCRKKKPSGYQWGEESEKGQFRGKEVSGMNY